MGTKSCPQNWDTKTALGIVQISAHGAPRRLFPAFCNAACGALSCLAAPRPDASAPEQNHRDCATRVTPLPFVVQRSSAIDTRCVGHIRDIWELRYLTRRSKRIFGARGAWRQPAAVSPFWAPGPVPNTALHFVVYRNRVPFWCLKRVPIFWRPTLKMEGRSHLFTQPRSHRLVQARCSRYHRRASDTYSRSFRGGRCVRDE